LSKGEGGGGALPWQPETNNGFFLGERERVFFKKKKFRKLSSTVVGKVFGKAMTTNSSTVISSSDYYKTNKVKRICRGLADVPLSDA
jgi:hypothetical protein